MTLRILSAICLAAVLIGCSPNKSPAVRKASPGAAEARDTVPQAQLPRVAIPTRYAITLGIDPAKERFKGHAEIAVQFSRSRRTLFIHGLDLHVTHAVALLEDGRSVRVSYDQVDKTGVARLAFATSVPKGNAKLSFDYDAPFNTSLAGLYKVVDRGDTYAFTQFENTDARRAFPSFDEPGYKTPFDIRVIAPSQDRVVGNTPITAARPLGKGMTLTVFAPTKPLPTYLVALAVGPLDIVDGGVVSPNQYRNYAIPVRGVTARGNGRRLKYALSLTPALIAALEDYYGIAYPFAKLDVLAVPDFAAGAMENAGAITFRERLLLDADQSLEQRRASMTVQAHELAHQWFGDSVTPVWWDDIWLNESFANWMEVKASATVRPNEEYGRDRLRGNLEVMALDEAASARRIHQPVRNMDDIDNAFDSITYEKGAGVLGMFESYVGEAGWRAGIHVYLTKFAFRNATARDFIATIAEATKHPEIVGAFNSYIDQPGIPDLFVDDSCEANEKLAAVKQRLYTQIGRAPEVRHWDVPMCLGGPAVSKTCSLIGPDLTQVKLKSRCTATVTPNEEGKGYYRFSVADAEWAALLKAAPALNPADQLTLFANIDAAFRAGGTPAKTYFDALQALAPIATWDLLKTMQASLHRFRTTLLEPSDLAEYHSLMTRLFVARFRTVGIAEKAGEPPATTLAREYLAMLAVEEARDPASLRTLAQAVAPYLASGGKTGGQLAPDTASSALRAGVILKGAPFADRLVLAMKGSNSESFRRSAIYALAGAQDKSALASLFAWSAEMRIGELRYLYQYMKDEPVARDAFWAFLKSHFAMLERRVSAQGFGRAPSLLENACSMAARDDLRAFFGPKTGELEGTARPLAQSEEKIGYCIALKAAKGREFAAALQRVALRPLQK